MKHVIRVCLFTLASVILFSCNFEKRLYRSGFYVSHPVRLKNNLPKDSIAYNPTTKTTFYTNEQPSISKEKEFDETTLLANVGSLKSTREIKYFKKKIFKDQTVKENIVSPAAPDEDVAKKDAKSLLFGSIASFFASLLYGLFIVLKILFLSDLFFILIPFTIIGLWIFSLLLFNKYSHEDSYSGVPEKKKVRTYSQRTAFLLAGFLGIFGAHRFYLGYPKMGLLEMFTFGGFFILYFVDLIRIKYGKLKPFDGEYQKGGDTYSRGKKGKVPDKTLSTIKLSLLISVAALLFLLGFVIFL